MEDLAPLGRPPLGRRNTHGRSLRRGAVSHGRRGRNETCVEDVSPWSTFVVRFTSAHPGCGTLCSRLRSGRSLGMRFLPLLVSLVETLEGALAAGVWTIANTTLVLFQLLTLALSLAFLVPLLMQQLLPLHLPIVEVLLDSR